jgi:uncharacterized protein YbjT (DUF2867 family)
MVGLPGVVPIGLPGVGPYAPGVARVLIVGGGRRGVRLAERMTRDGHAVRIVTRTEERRAQIEAAGAECWIGDPQRLGTLRGALEGVTIACWLLGTASGTEQELGALHGPRLRAFLQSAVDTTVRGVVYEVAGTVAEATPTTGERIAVAPSTTGIAEATPTTGERIAVAVAGANAMPLAILRTDPRDLPAWLEQAHAAVDSLLGPSPRARVLAPDTLS